MRIETKLKKGRTKMNKILILRTFEVSQVWEPRPTSSNALYRYGQYFDRILKWEPGWADLTCNDVSFAIGIYIPLYFRRDRFKGSAGENQPSLIKMERRNNTSPKYYDVFDWGVKFYYRVERKLTNFQRQDMFRLDSDIIEAKKKELLSTIGSIPKVDFIPLSFTLPADIVKNILATYGSDLEIDYQIPLDKVTFGRLRESKV